MKMFSRKNFIRQAKGGFNTSIIIVLILAIVQPFGLENMAHGRIPYILMMGLLTFLTGLFSSFLVNICFDKFYKKYNGEGLSMYLPTFLVYLINIPFLTLAFGLLNVILYSFPFSFDLFYTFFKYVTALTLFVFLWECLLVKKESLEKELDDVKAMNALLEKRQEEFVSKSEEELVETPVKCVLKGQTNSSELEVDVENIVYIESIANYADVCYVNGDDMLHKTLRITLKSVRESIGEDNNLVQCHRAFIVNLNFVVAIEKTDTGCQLQLFGMEKRIPVSRSNASAIKEKLQASK